MFTFIYVHDKKDEGESKQSDARTDYNSEDDISSVDGKNKNLCVNFFITIVKEKQSDIIHCLNFFRRTGRWKWIWRFERIKRK